MARSSSPKPVERPSGAQVNSTFTSRAGKGEPVSAYPGNTTFAERASGHPAQLVVPGNTSFAERAKAKGGDKRVADDEVDSKAADDGDE